MHTGWSTRKKETSKCFPSPVTERKGGTKAFGALMRRKAEPYSKALSSFNYKPLLITKRHRSARSACPLFVQFLSELSSSLVHPPNTVFHFIAPSTYSFVYFFVLFFPFSSRIKCVELEVKYFSRRVIKYFFAGTSILYIYMGER